MVPSKAGSETGDESQRGTGVASPTDSNLAKDKLTMTREEREAKYKERREELFGPQSETIDTSEVGNEVSRTSSRNEKKKKKHKNNDDGFEARSQFNAYYPNVQYPVATYDQTTAPPPYYSHYTMQQGNMLTQPGAVGAAPLQQGYQQGYNQLSTPQCFPAMTSQNPAMSGYDVQAANAHAMNYNQQISSHYYASMQQGIGMGQSSPVISPPAVSNHGQFSRPQSQLSDQQWPQNNYPYPYAQQRDQQQYFSPPMQSPNPMAGVASVPYQYGQLPLQPGMQGARAQHPLPGSYKGQQAFNPQTRSFVPNGSSVPPQTAQHANISSLPARSLNGNQHSQYIQQPLPYHQGPSVSGSAPYSFSQEPKAYGTRKSSTQSNATHSPVQSSLSKWGTPSHLPPKPPPPEVPGMPDAQHSLPMNNQFNVSVQPLNGGQQMPSFQNGVYTMPGVGSQAT